MNTRYDAKGVFGTELISMLVSASRAACHKIDPTGSLDIFDDASCEALASDVIQSQSERCDSAYFGDIFKRSSF